MESRHILLTTDLSEEATRAFDPIRDLARAIDAKITVLHVIQVLTETPQHGQVGAPISFAGFESEQSEAELALEKQTENRFDDVEVKLCVVPGADVAKTIAHFAERSGVGLIALSTHGRTGLRRLVLGSVAEKLLRHTHAPILCFPAHKPNGEGE